MSHSVEDLTRVYLKIRAKRSEIKREYEEQYNDLGDKLDKIKGALLEHCKLNDIDSFRTKDGTVSRSVTTKYWTDDWTSMHEFIVEEGVPQLLNKQLNQANLKQFLEENPEKVPPGLNNKAEFTISVRKR